MKFLIIPSDRISELDEINARYSDRVCITKTTIDGVILTNADKLAFPDDKFWSPYIPFLSSLSPYKGEPTWIPDTTEDEPS
jgi:hypothetical protein